MRNKQAGNIFMEECFFCEQKFQMSHHIYDGQYSKCYGDIPICKTCWESNWDGWVEHYAEKLLVHLKNKNISIPNRNEKGWIPREI